MSTVSDQMKCPQCGYEEADHEFDCRTSEEETLCTRCGYRESWESKLDDKGQFSGWKHEIKKGYGTLWYRGTGGVAFACHSLHAEKELAEAERWLKQQLHAGTVEEDTARVTWWNEETKRVELVVGTLDYAGRMEQVVADLGLKSIRPLPGKAVRFAILPGKAAVIRKSSWIVMPVLHYLNADPSNGNYAKRADGSMPPIEYELAYLAVSPSELKEISRLQNEASSQYGSDMVFVPNGEFGRREFYRVSNIVRWTQDRAIAKRVQETANKASSEFAAKCTSRSDMKIVADLPAAYPKGKNPVSSAVPVNNKSDVGAQMPVTLDEWHRALGFYKCATCGEPLHGTKYAWQGKNRWCLACFWGEDSEDAVTKIPAESGTP
jgi:hypothetical protein